jgi:Anti-sigma-K factor rskA
MTERRPPDFDELVGADLEPGERDRLLRVHDLLIAAGPPPELPPALAPPEEGATVVPIKRPSRRRLAVGGVLAAAVAAAAFGAGLLLGGSGGDDESASPSYVVEMTGDDARASLAVFAPDAVGNWGMRMTAQGLDADETYQLWLTRDGKPVRLCGSFAAGDGRTVVEMNAPWELRRFDGWVVTRAGSARPVRTQANAS